MYLQKINVKQAELDLETSKNPNQIQKYTARAHVDEEPRTFQVRLSGITMHGEPTPLTQEEGGKVYYPDKRFIEVVSSFVQKHPEYDITFYPTSKYGPTVPYCGDGYVSFLQATTGEILFIEHPDDYDCQVM